MINKELFKTQLVKIKGLAIKTAREDLVVFLLIITTWFKLIYLDRIIYDWPILNVFLIFTLATSILIFSPAFLLKKLKIYFAILVAFSASFVIWANTVYFRFFGSLIKIESLAIANQATDVSDSVVVLMRTSDVVYFLDIFLLIIVLISLRYRPVTKKSIKERLATFSFFMLLSVSIISIIFLNDRVEHLEKFIYRNFDINQIERRYGALGVHGINSYRYLFISNKNISPEREKQVVDWVKENKVGQAANEFTGIAASKNIFLIQLESVQSFAVGKEFEGQEITPNINQLVRESYYFPNGNYMIGGGKTSDSDFSVNTSLYPLADSSVFVQHGRHNFTSLPKALAKEGYYSYAYHAYKRDFWNRNLAFNSLGFDKYYAADNYPEGTNIIMGLNDVDFYKESLTKIKGKEGPNYHYLISLTSHYPFDMAPEHLFLKGDVNNYDYRTFHYYQSIHYADYALGVFMDGLKQEGLYDDSLIIVYGDHSAKFDELDNPMTLKTLGIDNINNEALYDLQKVPFVIKIPNQVSPRVDNRVISQIDLMPTVLNLVGVNSDFPMFGSDIFANLEGRYLSSANELNGLSVVGDSAYFVSPLSGESESSCFDLDGDWKMVPIKDCEPLISNKRIEQAYSWDLTRYNLFDYFY